MATLDLDFELLRCEQHIADLTLRINQLKETSLSAGSGTIASAEFIKLLLETLESWQERKKTLAESSSAPGKQAVGAARVPCQGK